MVRAYPCSYPADVFVRQQREASGSFTPLVSIEGGLLQPLWAGQRLQWVYGGLREGGGERVCCCPYHSAPGTHALPAAAKQEHCDVVAANAKPCPSGLFVQPSSGYTAPGSLSTLALRSTQAPTGSTLPERQTAAAHRSGPSAPGLSSTLRRSGGCRLLLPVVALPAYHVAWAAWAEPSPWCWAHGFTPAALC